MRKKIVYDSLIIIGTFFVSKSQERLYLPPMRNFNKETLASYLRGTTDFLKLGDVRWVGRIKDYPELSINSLLLIVNSPAGSALKKFLPSVD